MTGALIVSLLPLAWESGSRADGGSEVAAGSGAAQLEETCAGCHEGAQLDAVVRQHVEGRDARVALDAFLAEHHAADAELRADVIAQLLARLDLDTAPGAR